jgi:hypothetical protein
MSVCLFLAAGCRVYFALAGSVEKLFSSCYYYCLAASITDEKEKGKIYAPPRAHEKRKMIFAQSGMIILVSARRRRLLLFSFIRPRVGRKKAFVSGRGAASGSRKFRKHRSDEGHFRN